MQATKTRKHEEDSSKDDSFQAILQHGYIEVRQKTNLQPRHAQITQKLCVVHWRQPLHRLHFENYLTRSHNIEPLDAEELISIVHWDLRLAFKGNARCREFQANRTRIDTLKQTGTQGSMNGDTTADDLCDKLFDLSWEA
jgi:hypothetical protein